jgi:hypothetical protein
MGIIRTQSLLHWNFFLAIEEDMERLSRYVDFSGNDSVYSIEIARLFLSTCSEVDVVLKQLCVSENPNSTASSINQYYTEIADSLPRFINFEVTLPRFGLTLNPWSNWQNGNPPFWWQHHNKIKHHRHDNFEKANLKNCLNAVAGLYVAVLYLYKREAENAELLTLPRLFNVSNDVFGGTQMGRFGISFRYRL